MPYPVSACRGGKNAVSAAFDPRQIAGLVLWLDGRDLSALSDGDLIGTWPDKSGNGKDASAAGGLRPTYKTAILGGILPVARFSGSQGLTTPSINIGNLGMTIFWMGKQNSSSGTQMVWEMSENFNSHNDSACLFLNSDIPNLCAGATNILTSIGADTVLLTGVLDRALTTKEVVCYINEITGGTRTDTNSTVPFGNYPFYIGCRGAASLYFNGDMAQFLIFNRALTPEETAQVQLYLHGLMNPNLGIPCITNTADYSDNFHTDSRIKVDGGYYVHANPLSRLVYITDATSVDLEVFNNSIFRSYPSAAKVGARINGGASTVIGTCTKFGTEKITLTLGAGAGKTVELIGGLQAALNIQIPGVYITGVQFNAAATLIHPAYTSRVIVYGDSIAVGQGATNPPTEAWPQVVRNAFTDGSMVVEGWSGRSLHDDCIDAAARTAFASYLAAGSPTALWLSIGVNDYIGQKWSSADFGTAYADFLDKLHAALPAVTIYAQTMIVRSAGEAEIKSGYGDLPAYRAAIATAQSTRAPWCVLVDGSAILAAGDLYDGTHPSTAGYAKYAAAVKAVLGIS